MGGSERKPGDVGQLKHEHKDGKGREGREEKTPCFMYRMSKSQWTEKSQL